MKQKKLYIIAGPTAVGKTAIAIQLAQQLGTEIVSADSRQCYIEMNIGTARPSPAELAAVKHHFIAEFPVTRSLSAADYETLALEYLDNIFKTHDSAVVVGGTGLYIKALCEGLDDMPETDASIAEQVDELYKANGLEWLQNAVETEDPEFYAQAETQNPARLLRALSFIRTTGSSIIHYRTQQKKQRSFTIVKVGLDLPRPRLYDRINHRVDAMMAAGLLAEVEHLYPLRHLKNLQTVGYAELFDYMDGKCTLPQAVEKIKQHTRNYAKRQLTWFRRDAGIHWFSASDPAVVGSILEL